MANCTFPFRFRTQCNSEPVLDEETGPQMPDRALVLLYSTLLGKTRKTPARRSPTNNFRLEVQFGGDVIS